MIRARLGPPLSGNMQYNSRHARSTPSALRPIRTTNHRFNQDVAARLTGTADNRKPDGNNETEPIADG